MVLLYTLISPIKKLHLFGAHNFYLYSTDNEGCRIICTILISINYSPEIPCLQNEFCFRRRIIGVGLSRAKLSESNVKRANLSARKNERIVVPSYSKIGRGNMALHISEFINHPSGVEAILNTRALRSFQSLDSNMYRCVLPQIQLLNFEVAPVLDLQVTSTKEDCTVEMLSCKFEGSELMEGQNEHFSASMRNHITWGAVDSDSFLNVDVKLNVTLEIYTYPFTLLPDSAVEGPGNLMMQALVDRLVPLHVQQLLVDYDKWVRRQQEAL